MMAVGHNKTRLLYAWNHISGQRFLVDTGAEVAFFPPPERTGAHATKEPS